LEAADMSKNSQLYVICIAGLVSFVLTSVGFFYLKSLRNAEDVHLGLQSYVTVQQLTLPERIDERTTLTDVNTVGTNLTYTYEVDEKLKDVAEINMAQVEHGALQKGCSGEMAETIKRGASYTYVYLSQNKDRIGTFTISKCP